MDAVTKPTIPTDYLPKDWKEQAAERFGLEPETIRKIAKGHRQNTEVFDFLLEMAEKGKAKHDKRIRKAVQLKANDQPLN